MAITPPGLLDRSLSVQTQTPTSPDHRPLDRLAELEAENRFIQFRIDAIAESLRKARKSLAAAQTRVDDLTDTLDLLHRSQDRLGDDMHAARMARARLVPVERAQPGTEPF